MTPDQKPGESTLDAKDLNAGRDNILVSGSYFAPPDLAKVNDQLYNIHSIITDPRFFERAGASILPFDHQTCERASLADIDLDQAEKFFRRDLVQRQKDFKTSVGAVAHLKDFGLLVDSRPTYALLLVFATSPQNWIPGSWIRCVQYQSTVRDHGYEDDEFIKGNLVAQYEQSMNFLLKRLRYRRIIENTRRAEDLEIPLIALQEAVANAIVHREYRNNNDNIQIEIYLDRVEIKSPGSLPAPLTVEDITKNDVSRPRNPHIARLLYLYGQIERLGTGISRIQNALKEAGLKPAIFESEIGRFKVVFIRPELHIPTSIFTIPAPPRDFTGREKEINSLVKLLTGGGRAAITGLTGMGGIGKSALASLVANQIAANYPDGALWIDMRGFDERPLTPTDAMRQMILAFNPTQDLRGATEGEIAQTYRALFHGKRALIVLDNARDAKQVRDLLKAESAFIVTSRRQFVEQGLILIRLDVLDESDARVLLKKLCARLTEDELVELTDLCGRLPLALRIAGSHLGTRPNESVTRYIEKLRERRLEFLKEYGDTELDVEATFALTYDRLDPETQRRWRFLAVFPAPFDVTAAAYVWDVETEEAETALGNLVKESLVEYSEGKFRLHDLLRDFARA